MSGALTVLGSADALFSAGRGHSCFLLEDAAGAALIDCGATALLALARAGLDPARIDAVHFTHLHGDHILGWPILLIDALHRAHRVRPLAVTGPPGTRERLAALFALSYPDTAKRSLPFALDVVELDPGARVRLAGRTIEARFAQHQKPPHVALSLRIEGPAGLVAFTGDTGPHAGLPELAAGARLLVAECTELAAALPAAERRHLAWSDLRQLLPSLGGVPVALVHLGADARAAAAQIEAEAGALGIDLQLCDDGYRIAL